MHKTDSLQICDVQAEAKHQEEVGRGQEGVDEVMEEEEIDFEGLLRPEPWPVQGDIIAYRLLHIGADWTPQVSGLLSALIHTGCL